MKQIHQLLRFVVLAVLIAKGTRVDAQATGTLPYNISVQTIGPAPQRFYDLFDVPGKLLATAIRTAFSTDTTARYYWITGKISSDNGFYMQTNELYQPSKSFFNDLTHPVTVFTSTELKEPFLPGNVTIRNGNDAWTPADLSTKNLPEGKYKICYQIHYILYNQAEHTTPYYCSAEFSIGPNIEPPTLISPFCGKSIAPLTPQQVIFNWTPVIAQEPVTYHFRILELIDGQDPQLAMDARSGSLLHEETSVATTLVYGISSPALTVGKKYAWRVTAETASKGIIKNNGKSNVCTFTFGEAAPQVQSLSLVAPIVTTTSPFTAFSSSTISGNINTTFQTPPAPLVATKTPSTTSASTTYTIPSSVLNNLQGPSGGYQPTGSNNINLTPTTSYQLPVSLSSNAIQPLKSCVIHLMYAYIIAQPDGKTMEVGEGTLPSNCRGTLKSGLIATTTTGSDGTFKFSFYNPDSCGLIAKNVTSVYHKGDLGDDVYTGDLYRVFKIEVDNPHFCNPDDQIVVQPFQTASDLHLYTRVRNYSMRVGVETSNGQDSKYITSGKLKNCNVYVLRGTRPQSVPDAEGYPKPAAKQTKFGMEVIAMANNGSQDSVLITNLVKNIGPNDKYYLYAETDSSDNFAFHSSVVPFQFDFTNITNGFNISLDYMITRNADFQPQRTQYGLKLNADKPKIYGTVTRKDNQKSVGGVQLSLNYGQLIHCTSGQDGSYEFMIPPVDPPTIRLLSAIQPGFDLFIQAVDVIKLGEKRRIPIDLYPPGILKGKIINDQGQGVQCKVTVLGGATVDAKIKTETVSAASIILPQGLPQQSGISHAQPTVTSPLSQQQLPLNSSQVTTPNVTFQYTGSTKPAEFEGLASPLGKQYLIIDPDDESYLDDTLEISVSKGTQDLGTFTVVQKKHRIQVKVIECNSTTGIPNLNGATMNLSNTTVPGMSGAQLAGTTHNQSSLPIISNTSTLVLPTPNLTTPPAVNGSAAAVGSSLTTFLSSISNSSIKGAMVSIDDRQVSTTTGSDGMAKLTPFGGGDDFTIRVEAPDGKEYQTAEKQVIYEKTRDYITVIICLKPAISIKGTVTSGGAAVAGATISIDGSELKTTSDSKGVYTLHDVPSSKAVVVKCFATGGSYLGEEKSTDCTTGKSITVDFNLKQSPGLDLTQLLQFPISVTKLDTLATGYKISGEITDLPGNTNFKRKDKNQPISFKNIEVVKTDTKNSSGAYLLKPVKQTVTLNNNSIDLLLQDTYTGQLLDEKGLRITANADGSGTIAGTVWLDASASFENTNIAFKEDSVFVLRGDGSSAEQVPVFTSQTTVPSSFSAPLPLGDKKADGFGYELYNLKIAAEKGKSMINDKKVQLSGILHTNIQDLSEPDLKIDLGTIDLTKTTISNVGGTTPLTIPIEKWKIQVSNWSLNSTGLHFKTGKIATHVVDVDFTNMKVTATELLYGDFNLEHLNLKGVATMDVSGKALFLRDDAHWKVAVVSEGSNPAGSIAGLPGLSAPLKIKRVTLLSNETGTVDVDPATVKIYDTYPFKPNSLIVFNDNIKIPGELSLDVPQVSGFSTALQYARKNGILALTLSNSTFEFAARGVQLKFSTDENSLTDKSLVLKGTLSEQGLYSLKAALTRTATSASIDILPGERMPIDNAGLRYINNVKGNMSVANGEWKYFSFEGDLAGTTGANSHMNFTVTGDIVATNQDVKVDNISTPFGNLSVTFDFKKRRLIGNLHIDKEVSTGCSMKGDAESVVDERGWYFCSGLQFILKDNTFIKDGTAAIIFGDYPIANEDFVKQVFTNYSFDHSLPKDFREKVSGFYFDATANIPNPIIPDVDIDIIIASVKLESGAKGDFSMGMDFSNGTTTIYTGTALDIYATLGGGASVLIGCGGGSLSADVLMQLKGQYQTSGQWFVDGTATMTLTGSVYAGVGCCDSDCDSPFYCPIDCYTEDYSLAKSFKLNAHYGSDDKYLRFETM